MSLAVNPRDVLDYLGIEIEEVDQVITRMIERQASAADRFLHSAIGDYDANDPRVRELLIMITAELYSSRGVMSSKHEASLRRIAEDFICQLRLEGRGDD